LNKPEQATKLKTHIWRCRVRESADTQTNTNKVFWGFVSVFKDTFWDSISKLIND